MDLGTGKDYDDYEVEGRKIKHHLIDVVDSGYKYSVFEFQRDFLEAYEKIHEKSSFPILCGGTGMYIEAAVKGFKLIKVAPDTELRKNLETKSKPELQTILSSLTKVHNVSDTSSKKRMIRAIEIHKYYEDNPAENQNYPKINNLFVGINIDRISRRRKISERLKSRLDAGMIKEVEDLLESGITAEDLIFYGLEYKYLTNYIIGNTSYEEMFKGLETAIHQFAKRQMTWFRGMERRGMKIHWLDAYMPNEEKVEMVDGWLKV
jgi:tRNA dimethylallyltransferase